MSIAKLEIDQAAGNSDAWFMHRGAGAPQDGLAALFRLMGVDESAPQASAKPAAAAEPSATLPAWEQLSPEQREALIAPMREAFRQGRFEAGLLQAVDAIDGLLRRHHAVDAAQANPNELPNRPLMR